MYPQNKYRIILFFIYIKVRVQTSVQASCFFTPNNFLLNNIFETHPLFPMSHNCHNTWIYGSNPVYLKKKKNYQPQMCAKSWFTFDLTRNWGRKKLSNPIACRYAKSTSTFILQEGLAIKSEMWVWSNFPDNSVSQSCFDLNKKILKKWLLSCLRLPTSSPHLLH